MSSPEARRWTPLTSRNAWVSAVLLGLVAAWLFGLGGYPLVQWSGLNCTHEDIDIRTGRIRTTHILAGLKASERAQDSALTKALTGDDLRGAEADWHRVNTFSPGVHYSPHYSFHGAIHQARLFEELYEYNHLSPQARREIALTILELWREKRSYFSAGRLLRELDLKLGELSGEPTDETVRAAIAEALRKSRKPPAPPGAAEP